MSHGRSLASPAFPDDDGSLDPVLGAAFDEFDSTGDPTAVLGALCSVRVFVPVIALLGDTPAGGDMAAVFMTGADGRKALLAFSSVDAMQAWDPQARPVPIFAYDAARATLEEEASALLLDLGGSHFTVVETEDVAHLAAGHQLVQSAAGTAWVTAPAD
ncbi:MAG: SseB family protein [Actinomycetota bacterium]|nr:SseB family protein [Actinomycetota bacterium]